MIKPTDSKKARATCEVVSLPKMADQRRGARGINEFKKPETKSWFYNFNLKTIGTIDDLELPFNCNKLFHSLPSNFLVILEPEKFMHRGMKVSIINVLQKDYKFLVRHDLLMGKKEVFECDSISYNSDCEFFNFLYSLLHRN
jgi:hypothetical protein